MTTHLGVVGVLIFVGSPLLAQYPSEPKDVTNSADYIFGMWNFVLDRAPTRFLQKAPPFAAAYFRELVGSQGRPDPIDKVAAKTDNLLTFRHTNGATLAWSCPSYAELWGRPSPDGGAVLSHSECAVTVRSGPGKPATTFKVPFDVEDHQGKRTTSLALGEDASRIEVVASTIQPEKLPNWLPRIPSFQVDKFVLLMSLETVTKGFGTYVFSEFESACGLDYFRALWENHFKPYNFTVLSGEDNTLRMVSGSPNVILIMRGTALTDGRFQYRVIGLSRPPESK